jgi:quaternary ammonium compound-resistance protein SugE
MNAHWWALAAAVALEIFWVAGLKQIGVAKPVLSVAVLAAMAATYWMLWLAVRGIPVGTAYAIWTGLGAIGAVIAGIVLYKEPATVLRIASVAAIVAGVIGLKLATP